MVNGLGKRLGQARANLHLSQKEATAAIGASASVISNYESGERTPSVENLMALASLYRCSSDYLLGLDRPSGVCVDASMLDGRQRQLLHSCNPETPPCLSYPPKHASGTLPRFSKRLMRQFASMPSYRKTLYIPRF